MVKLDTIQSIYFIGIGGIGMSALARYFASLGKEVGGYDRTPTLLTRQLAAEGMAINYTDDPAAAPAHPDLVVYTPAVPASHGQLAFYRQQDVPVTKRSEVLGAITEGSYNICIAGTHGKTTISTMVAHILRDSGYGCNAFLGGIAVNYNSNFWSSERDTCVVEADEYDRSFLKLSPDIAVITAMDADHLDIYGTQEAMKAAFVEFSSRVKKNGILYIKRDVAASANFPATNTKTYSGSKAGTDIYADNIRTENGRYVFDVKTEDRTLKDIVLHMGGLHNVENATISVAIAMQLGIEGSRIMAAMENFRGVKRRFEYVVKRHDLIYIDDYAHHPAELSALIGSARKLFSVMKCTVIFQPHLYSRTRDLAAQFAESLDLADEVVLLPVYPARELPIEGVSSNMIADKMKKPVRILDKKAVQDYISNGFRQEPGGHLLITAGAGDIDMLVGPFKQILTAT